LKTKTTRAITETILFLVSLFTKMKNKGTEKIEHSNGKNLKDISLAPNRLVKDFTIQRNKMGADWW
jgi:hypothetical protein